MWFFSSLSGGVGTEGCEFPDLWVLEIPKIEGKIYGERHGTWSAWWKSRNLSWKLMETLRSKSAAGCFCPCTKSEDSLKEVRALGPEVPNGTASVGKMPAGPFHRDWIHQLTGPGSEIWHSLNGSMLLETLRFFGKDNNEVKLKIYILGFGVEHGASWAASRNSWKRWYRLPRVRE